MALRVLFIGGNGIISSAVAAPASSNAATTSRCSTAAGTRTGRRSRAHADLVGDADDAASISAAIGDETFDVVANFRSFSPDAGRARPRAVRRPLPASTSTSRRRRPTRSRSRTCRSPSRRRCGTRTGSTRATRSRARTCSSPPTASADSRRRSSARRTRTTGRSVPLLGGWTAIDRMRRGKAGRRAGRRHEASGRSPTRATSPSRSPASSATTAPSARRSTSRPTRCSRGTRSASCSPGPRAPSSVRCTSRAPRSPASCPRTGPASSATRRTP